MFAYLLGDTYTTELSLDFLKVPRSCRQSQREGPTSLRIFERRGYFFLASKSMSRDKVQYAYSGK